MPLPASASADRGEQRRRRADQEIAADAGLALRRRCGSSRGQRQPIGAQPVHLPVAGDQLALDRPSVAFSVFASPPLPRASRGGPAAPRAALPAGTPHVRHDHTAVATDPPRAIARLRLSCHDASDPLQGRLAHRQDPVRSARSSPSGSGASATSSAIAASPETVGRHGRRRRRSSADELQSRAAAHASGCARMFGAASTRADASSSASSTASLQQPGQSRPRSTWRRHRLVAGLATRSCAGDLAEPAFPGRDRQLRPQAATTQVLAANRLTEDRYVGADAARRSRAAT